MRLVGLRIAIAAILALGIGVAASTGQFLSVENGLRLVGFDFASRPASGQIHVIEMDAASVDAIQQWPWPRGHYAQVVDQLDAAGVRSIGFDVDFSSQSTSQADVQFAEAIERANAPVILPTFAQAESYGSDRKLDSLPIAPLREHAKLASVSIAPDPDGLIRRMPFGTITSETPRPSLSAYFSEQGGSADAHFPIDFGIDVGSIPRHSFIDIELGRFDPAEFRGKDVLIGATAIEMGDRYATPRYGVTPGVLVQALAAETLLRGTPSYGSWVLPLAISALLSLVIFGSHGFLMTALRMMATGVITIFAWHYAYVFHSIWFEIAPALVLLIAAACVEALWVAKARYQHSRQTDRDTGLPNAFALQADLAKQQDGYVVAGAIDDIDVLKTVLGTDDFNLLLGRLEERLRVSTKQGKIYRTDDKVLSWVTPLPLCEIEELVAGLRAIMRAPIEVAGRRVDVSLTFGVAGLSEKRPVEKAASAASKAQRAGDAWRPHEADSEKELEQQVSILGELDEALRDGHMKVYYQPKLNLKTNQITCAEALIRWEHPTKGMLPPDSFIPAAEEAGRVEDLTLFVIRQSIEDMGEWCKRGLVINAAVNISARLLSSPSFQHRAEHMIEELGVPHGRLTFEVTESAELEDPAASIAALNRFKERGIAISMDDYGTGQSTLSYLKQLPLSELKIDRTFVQHAHVDRSDAMLVRSTVQLAHELGLQVVAEGIEDAECLEFLRSIECDYAQGYFVGRPMPANDLLELASVPAQEAA